MRNIAAILAIAAALSLTGCKPKPSPTTVVDTHAYKTFHMRGKVVKVDMERGEVTVNHEAVPGFMDAMTMPYKVKDPSTLTELHPGDEITADVLAPPNDDLDPLLDHIVVTKQASPDHKPAAQIHIPAAGDAPPDYALRNQDGRPVRISQFKGRAVLVTFIYTRCPLPEFCPRVTRNFAAIAAQLEASPELKGKAHLLCVSFDPAHDTPERLKAYAAQYLGSDSAEAFREIEFAVPSAADLKPMARFFGLAMTEESDETITHSLSTTLIGPDGRVVKFYPGNEWTVNQALSDINRLVA